MKNIITEPGETRHFILGLLAEACQKVWASPTDYATLDKHLGAYKKYHQSWWIGGIYAILIMTLVLCFFTLNIHQKEIYFLKIATIVASITGIIFILRQDKKLRSRVNWEWLDFFLEIRELLENVYNINNLTEINSEEMLHERICIDTRALVSAIQKNRIENPESGERVRLKNLVNLIVRLGWMNTNMVSVFHDGSDGEKVIWRARADWLYGELFKQA